MNESSKTIINNRNHTIDLQAAVIEKLRYDAKISKIKISDLEFKIWQMKGALKKTQKTRMTNQQQVDHEVMSSGLIK